MNWKFGPPARTACVRMVHVLFESTLSNDKWLTSGPDQLPFITDLPVYKGCVKLNITFLTLEPHALSPLLRTQSGRLFIRASWFVVLTGKSSVFLIAVKTLTHISYNWYSAPKVIERKKKLPKKTNIIRPAAGSILGHESSLEHEHRTIYYRTT